MRYAFGDVILVPFPFTDQSTTKRRPAVVISSSRYNTARPDLILLAITSQVRASLAFGEALIVDWQTAGLIKPSVFKPLITTIEQVLVIKRLGNLSTADETALRAVIEKIVGRQPTDPSRVRK
ncbi:MAG: type II toxin-antitoxin system PemK/MazF family toxin [Candidatus Competibacteraceae bacterium]|nr:MAG: type II toxin-antitoxin system PemK/MazF family toxin [Candidatus Competibacteraceae bacterium]